LPASCPLHPKGGADRPAPFPRTRLPRNRSPGNGGARRTNQSSRFHPGIRPRRAHHAGKRTGHSQWRRTLAGCLSAPSPGHACQRALLAREALSAAPSPVWGKQSGRTRFTRPPTVAAGRGR
jgi:hypothetical protein